MNLPDFQQLLSTPEELARMAAWVGAVLVALYLLKPRKRRVQVPFGGLWQKVLAQSEAQIVGSQLRRWLSLLLMLVVAGLMLLTLGDPLRGPADRTNSQAVARHHTVVIMDVSASMAALDGSAGSRLDAAKVATRAWLAKAPDDENILLLAASGHTEVRAGWGTDRLDVDRHLSALGPTEGGLDLRRALTTASQALGHRADPRVVLVTDGGPAELPLDVTPPFPVQYLPVGPIKPTPLTNLAVAELRVRPDATDPGRGTITLRLRNDGAATVPAEIQLAASDTAQSAVDFAKTENLRRLVHVDVPPGVSTHTIAGVDLTAARFATRVAPAAGTAGSPRAPDLAPYDDWGFAVLAERRELGVLLVSGGKVDPTVGNLYLAAALFAHGRVHIHHLAAADYVPAAWQAADRARHGVDVVVLDQAGFALPPGTPGLVLSIAPSPTEEATYAEGPELTVREQDHPAMRGVTFQDTNFDQVRVIPRRPGDVVLAGIKPKGAVMVARQDGVRRLEWGMDLLETDLGARYALPLLISNALLWLAGDDDPLLPPLPVGRPWAVEAPVDATWTVQEPGQMPHPARTSGRQLLGQSERQGIHVWRSDGDRVVARATVLAPTENPALVGPPGPAATTHPPPVVLGEANQGIARWAQGILAVLVLLIAEWLLYLRRRTL